MILITTHQSKLPILGLLIVALAPPAPQGELLSMRVAPSICSAPCDLVVTLQVTPSSENEMVELILDEKDEVEQGSAEGSGYYRLSELPLSVNSPRTFQVRYPMVPKGAYTLSATLWRHDGVSWIAAKIKNEVLVR